MLIFPSLSGAEQETAQIQQIRPEKPTLASPLPTGRDPFNWSPEQIRLFTNKQEKKIDYFADLSIQAIFWHKNNPFAVINHQIVTVDDFITVDDLNNKVQILAIQKEKILLRHGKEEQTLFFPAFLIQANETVAKTAAKRIN